ncbi:TolC family protein [Albibacterium indicum]|uniref:TolC family protein n=1 Tax=Albibacterium indicum TaxID=2292082 RepID=UPI000E546370|nr:TolC family protein [Pedobacter indicus]
MRTLLTTLVSFSIIFFISTSGNYLFAQNTLEKYVEEGLENNLVLSQKNVSWEKAMIGLQSAKSLYLPAVAFQTTYSTADGGRNIPLPLGDLLNGVYATLNQLTQTQSFPQLENEEINFFPKNYYDAKIRTTVPIINSDIHYAVKVNEQQIVLKEFELEIYKRELIKNIKAAYYNYLSALKAVEIYESTLGLAEEGKRVNEKLYESGKGLPVYVMRSESEIAQANAELSQAKQQSENAKLYFNSLLNRASDLPIDTSFYAEEELLHAQQLLHKEIETDRREELAGLKQVRSINESLLEKDERYFLPKLSGFLDLGSQAEGMKFNDQSRYYMVGLQLDIPIFSGLRNKYKIKEAKLELKNSQLQFDDAKRQLELSANVSKNKLKSSFETYYASQERLKAAAAYQRLIDRGFKAGVNSFIESIDARNQLTSAQLATQINLYNVLSAAAELERELNSNQDINP